ncbi:MAG: transglycosylase domain-containing protein [Clostridiales bacterium]|jgi:membrane peptidoglycan carboxypeptidase|nr:transglycosylase domain-containing protein [Clostridiales bacterium]
MNNTRDENAKNAIAENADDIRAERRVRRKRVLKGLGLGLGGFAILAFTASSVLLFGVFRVQNYQNLSPAKLAADLSESVFDVNGRPLSGGGEKFAALSDLPPHVPAAFISAEDKKFYKHKGVDLKRIAGAAVRNLKSGGRKEGGSTISQQLIKNTHLTNDKTLNRKLEEVKLTLQLEKYYEKSQILEYYLNIVYFGSGFYGIRAAALGYFDKEPKDLTLSETALLAGLLPSPERFSPHTDVNAALARRSLVLRHMLKDGVITADDYTAAAAEPLAVAPLRGEISAGNDYLDAALDEAAELTNLSPADLARAGYKIYTYADPVLQGNLRAAFAEPAYRAARADGSPCDRLALAIDAASGGVSAFYGESKSNLRRLKRQPGSAIKPVLVYAPALETGVVSPNSVILDEPTTFDGGYAPENYKKRYAGRITVKRALAESANIPAVKLFEYAGIDACLAAARRCGLTFDERDRTPAAALGGLTYGVTPLQLANSYLPFARRGKFIKASFIRRILNAEGETVYRHNTMSGYAFSPKTARQMSEILEYAARRGTARKLAVYPGRVAAKTGTVADPVNNELNSDAWCVSYTDRQVLGVWYGAGDGSALKSNVSGGTFPTALSLEILMADG